MGESQFATNHLGHFALTAQLLNLLKYSKHARIVTVSSRQHREAKMDLDEIMTPKEKYTEFGAYNNSKLYNLLFSSELNRRLRAATIENVIATTAHPGYSTTNVSSSLFANSNWFVRLGLKLMMMLPFFQTPEFGALPTLYAAVGENVERDDYIGPDGFFNTTRYPTKEQPRNVARSEKHARKLWEESEKLAKLRFKIYQNEVDVGPISES